MQIFFLTGAISLLIITPDKFFSKNYKRSELTRKLREEPENLIFETTENGGLSARESRLDAKKADFL